MDELQFRYFELALALSRLGKHKKSHYAWAKHDAYSAVIQDLFPYRYGGGKRLSDEYRKVQKEIKDLEGERYPEKTTQMEMDAGIALDGADEP